MNNKDVEQTQKYSAPALDKALDIIEFLADSPEGATLTEISTRLGRSMTTLYRVTQVLEQRGYIYSQGPKSAYHLSLKLYRIATRHYPVQSIIDASVSEIRAITRKTFQSCHLAVLNQNDITVVYQQDPPLAIHYSVAIGSTFPALTTSSGAVILAYSELDTQLTFFNQLETESEKRALKTRLDNIVKHGYEVLDSPMVIGITNLSVPVFDYTSSVVGAITIPYLPQKYQEGTTTEETLEQLKQIAQQISKNLGFL